MIRFKDKHKGETAWIIGKGTSLFHLSRNDIGNGPIIAIYEAIVPIEILNFPNELFSLQKDGGARKRNPLSDDPECDDRQCDFCKGMVTPKRATLLLHEKEAKYCFEDYPRRLLFTLEEIGLPNNEFSLVCALKIAQFMGCDKFRFVSCDAHANGDIGNFIPLFNKEYYGWIYGMQKDILPKYLEGLDYEWVTPK
uniref:Uncharacterized protein n=1 Tax=viral metagenome TaxID=1070528 RepID=A0A6M3XVK7_9ZZZZ